MAKPSSTNYPRAFCEGFPLPFGEGGPEKRTAVVRDRNEITPVLAE